MSTLTLFFHFSFLPSIIPSFYSLSCTPVDGWTIPYASFVYILLTMQCLSFPLSTNPFNSPDSSTSHFSKTSYITVHPHQPILYAPLHQIPSGFIRPAQSMLTAYSSSFCIPSHTRIEISHNHQRLPSHASPLDSPCLSYTSPFPPSLGRGGANLLCKVGGGGGGCFQPLNEKKV